MRKFKFTKSLFKRILFLLLSFMLLLLVIWLGYSFFSIKANSANTNVVVNIKNEELAKKAVYDTPIVEDKYISYGFEVVLHEIKEDEDAYTVVGVDRNFLEYFTDIEDATFEYVLEKGKGNFDFSKLEWNQPLLITLEYRVDKDFKYFTEYSMCVLKGVYSTMLDYEYKGDECVIERDVNRWSVEKINILNE